MLETGWTSYWKKCYWPKGDFCAENSSAIKHQKATVEGTLGAYIALSVGIFMALLTFVLEWWYYIYGVKQNYISRIKSLFTNKSTNFHTN